MNERMYQHNKAVSLNRGIDVLVVIKNTPIATTKEIKDQALPYMTIRSVQRYLKTLVQWVLLLLLEVLMTNIAIFLHPKQNNYLA